MVELILENEQDKEELTPEIEKAIKDVCVAVMEEEECDFDAEISVTLVDNDTIRSINKEQRDIDRATDVLSFPMILLYQWNVQENRRMNSDTVF